MSRVVRHVLQVKCGQCGKTFYMEQKDIIKHAVPGYPHVIDFGVVCPKGCFTHSFYLSQALDDETRRISTMEPGPSQAAARASYKKRFDQFQVDMQAQLGEAHGTKSG